MIRVLLHKICSMCGFQLSNIWQLAIFKAQIEKHHKTKVKKKKFNTVFFVGRYITKKLKLFYKSMTLFY